jgi:hypothetical protein
MADWFSPLLSTLKSSDALALQQIVRSIAQELVRLEKEIQDLKNGNTTSGNVQINKLR